MKEILNNFTLIYHSGNEVQCMLPILTNVAGYTYTGHLHGIHTVTILNLVMVE